MTEKFGNLDEDSEDSSEQRVIPFLTQDESFEQPDSDRMASEGNFSSFGEEEGPESDSRESGPPERPEVVDLSSLTSQNLRRYPYYRPIMNYVDVSTLERVQHSYVRLPASQ